MQATDKEFKGILGQVVELEMYDVALTTYAKKEVRLIYMRTKPSWLRG